MKIEIKTMNGTVLVIDEQETSTKIRHDVNEIIELLKEVTLQIKELEISY